QFPPPPSERSAPLTAGGSSAPLLQDLHAFHGLHPATPGSAPPLSPCGVGLTPRQASLHAADRSVAPTNVAFDAGLRRRAFPPDAASLLPGSLATTRTGLTPAGGDELTNTRGSDHQAHRPPIHPRAPSGHAVALPSRRHHVGFGKGVTGGSGHHRGGSAQAVRDHRGR